MTIVMTLLVRDEEDILEANLRFHESVGVDFFIVTDNASEDSTPQLLERWVERGKARVIREEQDDYAQAEWVTRMARMAATEHGADWVINADADEFFWPRSGDLRSALGSLPTQLGQVYVPRVNFPPTDQSEARVASGEEPFWSAMQVRDVTSRSPVGTPLPPKVLHRAHAQVEVEQGNHAVRGVPWPAPQPSDPRPVLILHFPQRSYAQFERKIRLGGAAYERNTTLDREIGRTWRELYEVYRAGGLPARYAQDVLSDDAVRRGIAAGTHVVDRRLATRLRALLSPEGEVVASPTPAPQVDVPTADRRIGVVAELEELLAGDDLLTAWSGAFDASDPVTLVIHAPDLGQDDLRARLLPAISRAGLDSDTAADVLVAATSGGAADRESVECDLIGSYTTRDSSALGERLGLALVVTPDARARMRSSVLGDSIGVQALGSGTAPSPEEVVERAMAIQGHLTPNECRLLVDVAHELDGGVIVEVGSFRGRSTAALALAGGDDVAVFAIDPHEAFVGEHGGLFGPPDRVEFFRNLLDAGVVERVRLVNLPSVEAAASFTRPIDFLWLDGDHADEAVDADFRAWDPHLRTGSLIAFHDAVDPAVGPGRVAGEAVASGRYELVRRVDKIILLRRVA